MKSICALFGELFGTIMASEENSTKHSLTPPTIEKMFSNMV